MGVCVSRPATVLTEKALEDVAEAEDKPCVLEASAVAPVRVFRDGKVR